MKVTVVGLGYVGMANAVLLSKHHDVTAYDIDPVKVQLVRDRQSPIADELIEAALATGSAQLSATTDPASAYRDAEVVIIATPTDYNSDTHYFDTSSVESVIADILAIAANALIVVKSTIPVGFTRRMRDGHPGARILFAPEFLREGHALYDNLHPSRIIVSDPGPDAQMFAALLIEGAEDPEPPVMLTGSTEAEAIKLFSNTYLAMRVAYFNELDTYAVQHGLDARDIIRGVGLDPRIGAHYNNPSFGYGGYCLPKDTKQLLANYRDVPQVLIQAIVESNTKRKDFIASDILASKPDVVGIYRLAMKSGSDNFRSSSVQGVLHRLVSAGVTVLIYEPLLHTDTFRGCEVVTDITDFTTRSAVIVCNRAAPELAHVRHKLYTRDAFGGDA